MDKTKRKNRIGKVYKPSRIRSFFLVLLAIIIDITMLLYTLWLASFHDSQLLASLCPTYLLTLAVCLLPNYVVLVQTKYTSIRFNEDGLEYQEGKNRLFVEWQDMSHLGRKNHGKSSSYGIFLRRKLQPEAQGMIDKLFFGWSSDYIRLSSIVKVPSRWDGCWKGSVVDFYKFEQTEFGYDLKHYAPHLFDKGKL